jgi:formamidopyrimidine-DNA glycosylase
MPELPEVQTIINDLTKTVIGKEINGIIEHRPGTVIGDSSLIKNAEISAIDRRGKYIVIETSASIRLIIHLRMTGKLILEPNPGKINLHTRAEILFSDSKRLLFDDIRTFGKIHIITSTDEFPAWKQLGAEPLNEDFTSAYLQKKINNRKSPIKNALLDQSVIAGLGNIYVSEILFRSKIDPRTLCYRLSTPQLKMIVSNTKQVLKEAIAKNGTTISDYRRVDDKTGEFQRFLRVYGKKTCTCGNQILKIKQAGRSTYFCPFCQKKITNIEEDE